jgi:hypothetical protein
VAALIESSWLRISSVSCRCPCRERRVDQGGQESDQAFGADAIGGIADQEERVLDIRT